MSLIIIQSVSIARKVWRKNITFSRQPVEVLHLRYVQTTFEIKFFIKTKPIHFLIRERNLQQTQSFAMSRMIEYVLIGQSIKLCSKTNDWILCVLGHHFFANLQLEKSADDMTLNILNALSRKQSVCQFALCISFVNGCASADACV